MVTEVFSLKYCFENEMSEKRYISRIWNAIHRITGLYAAYCGAEFQYVFRCSGVGIVFCTIIISAAAFIME